MKPCNVVPSVLVVGLSIWASLAPADAQQPKPQHTLKGHREAISGIAFTPDGKTLITASEDKTIKVWDATAARELATLKGGEDKINCLAASADGKLLATAEERVNVRVWDRTTGKERFALSHLCRSLAFAPDGKTLALANTLGKTVVLVNVATGKERAALQGHTQNVWSVAYAADGKTLASGSSDKTVKLWDPATGKERATLAVQMEHVLGLAFSPDGKTLAVGGEDRGIQLFDVATRKEKVKPEARTAADFLGFSSDGKTLVCGHTTVRLVDVATGKVKVSLSRTSGAGYTGHFALSPNRKVLAVGRYDGELELFDASGWGL